MSKPDIKRPGSGDARVITKTAEPLAGDLGAGRIASHLDSNSSTPPPGRDLPAIGRNATLNLPRRETPVSSGATESTPLSGGDRILPSEGEVFVATTANKPASEIPMIVVASKDADISQNTSSSQGPQNINPKGPGENTPPAAGGSGYRGGGGRDTPPPASAEPPNDKGNHSGQDVNSGNAITIDLGGGPPQPRERIEASDNDREEVIQRIDRENKEALAAWQQEHPGEPTLTLTDEAARGLIPQRVLELVDNPADVTIKLGETTDGSMKFVITAQSPTPITDLESFLQGKEKVDPTDMVPLHVMLHEFAEKGILTPTDIPLVYGDIEKRGPNNDPDMSVVQFYVLERMGEQELRRQGIAREFYEQLRAFGRKQGFTYIIGANDPSPDTDFSIKDIFLHLGRKGYDDLSQDLKERLAARFSDFDQDWITIDDLSYNSESDASLEAGDALFPPGHREYIRQLDDSRQRMLQGVTDTEQIDQIHASFDRLHSQAILDALQYLQEELIEPFSAAIPAEGTPTMQEVSDTQEEIVAQFTPEEIEAIDKARVALSELGKKRNQPISYAVHTVNQRAKSTFPRSRFPRKRPAPSLTDRHTSVAGILVTAQAAVIALDQLERSQQSIAKSDKDALITLANLPGRLNRITLAAHEQPLEDSSQLSGVTPEQKLSIPQTPNIMAESSYTSPPTTSKIVAGVGEVTTQVDQEQMPLDPEELKHLLRTKAIEISRGIGAGTIQYTPAYHPHLERAQTDMLFEALHAEGGETISLDSIVYRSEFLNEIKPTEIEQWAFILATSNNIRGFIAACHYKIVAGVADRYSGDHLSFEEAILAGNAGLSTAINEYDHTKGAKFSTFATQEIREEIIHALQKELHISPRIFEGLNYINRIQDVFQQLWNRAATREELDKQLRYTFPQISDNLRREILDTYYTPLEERLDAPTGTESTKDLRETVSDKSGGSTESTSGIADRILSLLTPQETALVLAAMQGETDEALTAMAQEQGIELEEVVARQQAALAKLRDNPTVLTLLRNMRTGTVETEEATTPIIESSSGPSNDETIFESQPVEATISSSLETVNDNLVDALLMGIVLDPSLHTRERVRLLCQNTNLGTLEIAALLSRHRSVILDYTTEFRDRGIEFPSSLDKVRVALSTHLTIGEISTRLGLSTWWISHLLLEIRREEGRDINPVLPSFRQTWVLRHLHPELSYRQIGEQVGVNLNQVYRQSKRITNLKKILPKIDQVKIMLLMPQRLTPAQIGKCVDLKPAEVTRLIGEIRDRDELPLYLFPTTIDQVIMLRRLNTPDQEIASRLGLGENQVPSTADLVVALRRLNIPNHEIAARLGIHEEQLHAIVKEQAEKGNIKFDLSLLEEIKRLRSSTDLTNQAISTRVGLSPHQYRYYIAELLRNGQITTRKFEQKKRPGQKHIPLSERRAEAEDAMTIAVEAQLRRNAPRLFRKTIYGGPSNATFDRRVRELREQNPHLSRNAIAKILTEETGKKVYASRVSGALIRISQGRVKEAEE